MGGTQNGDLFSLPDMFVDSAKHFDVSTSLSFPKKIATARSLDVQSPKFYSRPNKSSAHSAGGN